MMYCANELKNINHHTNNTVCAVHYDQKYSSIINSDINSMIIIPFNLVNNSYIDSFSYNSAVIDSMTDIIFHSGTIVEE